jgi:hypothetical protein
MSPTLFKIGNLRIVIYPNDHNPPHVHVIGPEGEAKFELKTLKCIFVKNFSKRDVRRMQEFLLERRELLLEIWNDYQA